MAYVANFHYLLCVTLLCNFDATSPANIESELTTQQQWSASNPVLNGSDHSQSGPSDAIAIHPVARNPVSTSRKDAAIIAQWQDLEFITAKLAVRAVYENLLPTIDDQFDQNNVSSSCQSSVYKVLQDAAVLKKYAVQMLDSCGKFPPSGMMEGTLTDLGRYDECLDIDTMLPGDDDLVSTRMRGQYCSVMIRPPLPPRPRFHTICNQIPSLMDISSEDSAFRWFGQNAQYLYYTTFRIGLCSPSQCSAGDVHSMISKLAMKFNMTAEILGMKCSMNHTDHAVNRSQLLCLLAFALVFLLVMTGTCVDVYRIGEKGNSPCLPLQTQVQLVSKPMSVLRHLTNEDIVTAAASLPGDAYWNKTYLESVPDKDSLDTNFEVDCSYWVRTLQCFSMRRNAAAILNVEEGKSGESLAVIHGLRVMTMAWIILGHTYGLVNPQIHSRIFLAKEMYTNFMFQGLLNATLSVDTFFFISGLLTVYTFWRRMRKGDSNEQHAVPWLTSTAVRYLRLTPAYAAVIALAIVFPLLSSGPLWQETADAVAEPCYESWWANLLYVNNFVKTEKLCLMHSWYLSNDMQMHVFAILFILLLVRSKMVAFLFMAAVMIACTVISAVQTFVNEYPPTIISTSPVVEDRWKFILDHYYKPWPHLPSYCIGLAVGFLIASRRRILLSQNQSRVIWLLVSLLCFLVLYGVYPWNLGWQIRPEVTAIYSSTFRTVWTLCCAWTVYSLLTNNSGSTMAHVLSWKGFLPFSRLTYMAFLVHPFVIWYYSGSARERFTPTHFNYFHLFLGHYLLTYILSFAFGLLFESPFLSLQKLLLMDQKNRNVILSEIPGAKQETVIPSPASSSEALDASVNSVSVVSGEADHEINTNSLTQIHGKRESFVFHVRNNCGSRSSVVYVNTV